MILHHSSTVEDNSGARVNLVLLINQQPDAFASLNLGAVKQKVIHKMC